MGELMLEHREDLLGHTVQEILFIEIMGIEGGTTNSCPVQNILHQNLIVGFFCQEFSKRGTHQVMCALGTTVCFLLFHFSSSFSGEQSKRLVRLRTDPLVCAWRCGHSPGNILSTMPYSVGHM